MKLKVTPGTTTTPKAAVQYRDMLRNSKEYKKAGEILSSFAANGLLVNSVTDKDRLRLASQLHNARHMETDDYLRSDIVKNGVEEIVNSNTTFDVVQYADSSPAVIGILATIVDTIISDGTSKVCAVRTMDKPVETIQEITIKAKTTKGAITKGDVIMRPFEKPIPGYSIYGDPRWQAATPVAAAATTATLTFRKSAEVKVGDEMARGRTFVALKDVDTGALLFTLRDDYNGNLKSDTEGVSGTIDYTDFTATLTFPALANEANAIAAFYYTPEDTESQYATMSAENRQIGVSLYSMGMSINILKEAVNKKTLNIDGLKVLTQAIRNYKAYDRVFEIISLLNILVSVEDTFSTDAKTSAEWQLSKYNIIDYINVLAAKVSQASYRRPNVILTGVNGLTILSSLQGFTASKNPGVVVDKGITEVGTLDNGMTVCHSLSVANTELYVLVVDDVENIGSLTLCEFLVDLEGRERPTGSFNWDKALASLYAIDATVPRSVGRLIVPTATPVIVPTPAP